MTTTTAASRRTMKKAVTAPGRRTMKQAATAAAPGTYVFERQLAMPSSTRPARSRPSPRVEHARIGGHRVRYAVRPGDPDRPPLLFLNGLGANIELALPFIDALSGTHGRDLRCARRRRIAHPGVALSAVADGPSRRGAARPSRNAKPTCSASRGAARSRSSSRSSIRRVAVGSCSRRRPWRADGACAPGGAAQDAVAAAIPRQEARASGRRRYLRGAFRREPELVDDVQSRPLLEQRRLLHAARRGLGLDQPAMAVHAAAADVGHGRRPTIR